jgi:endonuclease/exonuclease/phosphatase (EEP) superfamily protein YafD
MAGSARGWLRRWLSRALIALAIGYPVSLLMVWLLLRFVGESWWATSVALYLPMLGFGAPLLPLTLLLLVARRYRLLLLQLASLWLVLVPLMGLELNWPAASTKANGSLRVLSYNANSAYGGYEALATEITRADPDLAFVQEIPEYLTPELRAKLASRYPHQHSELEFLVASKFPLVSTETPTRLPFFGKMRSPRFMRVVVASPLGRVVFFHVHTVSPRGAFYRLRGKGLRREILSGRLFTGENAASVQELAALRALQIQALATMANQERDPVIIVGDTNLPIHSPVRRRYLGNYQDGFAEAGLGFGNTFPSKHPWMRIDLILASQALHFTRFEVGSGLASDHRSVMADVAVGER